MRRVAACLAWIAALVLQTPVRATEEVPFITTPDNVTLAMLQLAELRTSDHLIDLGSGDGRIVILAAKRFGASGLGVEIVPDLVQRSRENARAAGVETRAQFREQDLFKTDLSAATVVTMYLLPEVNLQLRPVLLALKPGTRIVSHDWDMGDWLPDRSITVAVPDKSIGREKSSRVHLWRVPAPLAGTWCGAGDWQGAALRLAQKFQNVTGQLDSGPGTPPIDVRFDGRIDGVSLRSAADPAGELVWVLGAEGLRVTQARGLYARWQGALFAPQTGEACR
jgi:SAM-dependent methyltransferase